MISHLYYGALISEILATVPGVKWRYGKNMRVITECGASYPNLYFLVDKKWIQVEAKDYVFHSQD